MDVQTTTPAPTTPPPGDAPAAGATATPPAPTNAGASGATTTTPPAAPVSALTGKPDANAGKPPEGQGQGDKPAAEELQVKLPEGVNEDAVLMGEFKPLAKELGLKSEGAQKLVDFHVKALTSLQEKAKATFETQHAQWLDSMKADKEFGGASFETNLGIAQRAIAKFGTPALQELLKSPAIGSQPELVRFMVRVGKSLAEDSVAASTGGVKGELTQEDRLKLMYPTHFKEQGD